MTSREHGRVAGAERDREIIGEFADPELASGVDDLGHSGFRRRAHGHQVARLLDAPAHGVRTGIAAVEIDEAFVAEPGTLPHAERRIDDDRCRGHAVGERGGVDDRLERRAGLAKRLGRPIVARPDDVEAALHREHSAGVHFLDQHAAGDLGDRAQAVIARRRLLDDDDHARLERVERGAADAAHRHRRARGRELPVEPLVKPIVAWPPLFDSTTALRPVRIADADRSAVELGRPVALGEIDAEAGSRQPRPPSNLVSPSRSDCAAASCIVGTIEVRTHRPPRRGCSGPCRGLRRTA